MTRTQLRTAVKEIMDEALALHAGKNQGYAYEDDGLSNFKKGAIRCRQTPIQYLWTLNSKQLLAVEEAIFDGKEVTYEKVEDKLLDNIVYSSIALAMIRFGYMNQPVTQPETQPQTPTQPVPLFHTISNNLKQWFGAKEAVVNETTLDVAEGETGPEAILDRGGDTT